VGRLALPDVAPLVRGGETVFVCGTAGFADAVTDLLVAAGVPTTAIRVERFGPSG
jgi:ferredoxin-NADP reductase